MTNLEFKILTFAKEHQESAWADILNALHPEFSYEDIGAVADALMADKCLEKTSLVDRPPLCRVRLTRKGRLHLRQLQQEESDRQQQIRKEQSAEDEHKRILEEETARNAKEKRSDRRFQLFLALLQALLSFISGLLVEHFAGVVDWILSVL